MGATTSAQVRPPPASIDNSPSLNTSINKSKNGMQVDIKENSSKTE